MAKYVSASAAARLLSVNEKTIRNWIQSGQLQAYHVSAKRFNVNMDEIRRVAAQRGIELASDTDDLKLHISSLDLELLQLRERLETLEQSLERIQKVIEQPVRVERQSISKEVKPRTTAAQSANKALPDGLVSFTDFYKAHGISETTARRDMQSSQFPVVSGSWQRGNNIIKQALDLSGQQAFCEYYAAKGKLQACSDETCVCYHVTDTE